jgi:hypothetical protein
MIHAACLVISCVGITISTPVQDAETVLNSLGRVIGKSLRPVGSVKRDQLTLQFTNASEASVLRAIEEATNASWGVESDGSMVLSRSNAQLSQDAEFGIRAATAKIARGIKAMELPSELPASGLRELVLEARRTEAEDKVKGGEYRKFDQYQPADRCLMQIIQTLDARELAQMPNGEHVKLSLGKEAERIYANFISEQQRLNEAIGPNSAPVTMGLYLRFAHAFMPNTLLQAKWAVTAYSYTPGSVSFQLHLWSSTEIGSASVQLNLMEEYVEPAPDCLGKIEALYVPEERFTKLCEVLQTTTDISGRCPKSTNDLAFEAMFKEDNPDFLEFFASTFYRQLSAAKKLDLVALVPDSINYMRWGYLPEPQPLDYEWSEQRRVGMKAELKNGVLILRPINPTVESRDRIDRPALNKLIRDLRQQKRLFWDAAGDFAVVAEDRALMWGAVCASLGSGTEVGHLAGPHSAPFVRFWGALTPENRRLARAEGVEFDLASLRPETMAAARKLIFGSKAILLPKPDPEAGIRYQLEPEGKGGRVPAIELAAGFPRGSKVKVKMVQRERYTVTMPERDTGKEQINSMVLEGLAESLAYDELYSERRYQPSTVVTTYPSYLTIQFSFPGKGYISMSQVLDETALMPPGVKFDKMPSEWHGRLRAEVAKARTRIKKMQQDDDQNRTPPPVSLAAR